MIGDGIYFYIQDIMVLPGFQGKGIGKHIMDALMDFLNSHVCNSAFIGLMAAKGVSKFYERYGFIERPPDRPGMFQKYIGTGRERKMNPCPGWQYNEMKQVGADYADIREVQAYDSRMQKLRDIKEETEKILNSINLTRNQTVLEFGTGTGEFAIEAAQHCSKIYATDVSVQMLEFAQRKAAMHGIKNIEFHNAGFLTYEHAGEPLDAVVSQLALHHLPDFWKMIALRRIHGMLKEGGKFYLRDTVYSFDVDNYMDFFNRWIEGIRQAAGDELADDAETAIRDEYTTPGWIMEELLKRAGFHIDEAEYSYGFMAVYVCTKS